MIPNPFSLASVVVVDSSLNCEDFDLAIDTPMQSEMEHPWLRPHRDFRVENLGGILRAGVVTEAEI